MTILEIPVEYLIFIAFSVGVYVTRNEIAHRRVCNELELILDHLGIKKPGKKR